MIEASSARQQMNDVWLQYIDTSAKNCFNRVKLRNSKNYIYSLQSKDGSWINLQEELLTLVVRVFQKGYEVPQNQPDKGSNPNLLNEMDLSSLTKDQCNLLLGIPSTSKIKHHMFNMKANASWSGWYHY